MATLRGTTGADTLDNSYSYFADTILAYKGDDIIFGGFGSETIFGDDGVDTIFAGFGADSIYGGTGNDIIIASSKFSSQTAAWGEDFVSGGQGSDYINYSMTTSSVTVYGDDLTTGNFPGADTILTGSGNDRIFAGAGDDHVVAGAGNDTVFGDMDGTTLDRMGNGSDRLYGGAGFDKLFGGYGNDRLAGGADADNLFGSFGTDTFEFAFGDSGVTWVSADTIGDFNRSYDWIDMPFAANASNYAETYFVDTATTPKGTFDLARVAAANLMQREKASYAFVTDREDGFLFADLNRDGYMDTGVVLQGLRSLADLNASDII